MGFEDLWEKYGEKREQELPSDVQAENESAFLEHSNGTENRKKNETVGYKKVDVKPKVQMKEKISDTEIPTLVGVFGDENDMAVVDSNNQRVKNTNSFDFSGVKNWPWLDIIFIAITLIMIVGVIANFEKVTTALFNMLLPLLCNILVFVVVIGLVVALIWWFTRSIRRPRRRW